MDALQEAISLFLTQADLARAIGLKSPQTLNNWVRRGSVPADYCPAIERATKGRVRCEALRPDVDWAYLRGTEQAAA